MPTIAEILARELDKPLAHVQNVIDLLDQGNTIPFIARYRKELHGSMDDTALRTLEDRLNYLRNLAQRREEVKNAIDGQGKLTQELSAAIDNAATLAEVEDLYRPYKQKRRTRATVAREKGLEPLAQLLLAQGRDCPDPETAAAGFRGSRKRVWRLWPMPSRGPTTSWRSCCRTMPPSARPCGSCCAARAGCGVWPLRRRTPSTACIMTLTSPSPSWPGTRSWPSIGAKRRASSQGHRAAGPGAGV